jgi:hypothetical protein
MKNIASTLILISAFGLFGCGQETGESPNPAGKEIAEAEQAPNLPGDFFLQEDPSGTVPLHEARANATTGEEVAFTGYIGGRAEPFTEGRALFLVTDSEKAPACTDACEVPWDACCVPRETIAANSAAVQVVDEAGGTLRLGLKGKEGLVPGAGVTVVGEVREASEDVFIVDASALKVHP